MIGGEDCALYNQTEEQKNGEISCYAPDGRFTEVRHQMTLREIQAWAWLFTYYGEMVGYSIGQT
ncbi:hypothetical protein [Turicimonas muris]|uniref:hypothetical protein n=1 Tax=Turicimonas muris TaxID=1796652 RepID=UPI00248C2323|nr:hypothetical protein [Turicimonas muris]